MSEVEALKSLGAFPLLQAAVAIVVVMAGIWLALRATRDTKKNGDGAAVPQWLMMGPAHDVMGAVHEMAEQGRQQTDLLKRIEVHLVEVVKETHNNTAVLEMIRNESRLR